jgi:hypothetical protein
MSDLRLGIIDGFAAVTAEVRSRFGSLTGEQLEWRPPSGGWSVAQCIEHLVLTTDAYLEDLHAIAAGRRRPGLWERISPFSRFFGRFLREQLERDASRTKTSARFVPPSEVGTGIVERFAGSQDRLAAAIRATSGADWDRTIVSSSFSRVVTYSLGDAYGIMLVHQRRHVRQAHRVTEEPGFPRRVA